MTLAVSGLIALLATLAATAVVRRLALGLGVVARPAADRWHRRDVPLLGGVGVAAVVAVAMPIVAPLAGPFGVLLGGALVMLLVGLLDDVRPLSAETKFVAEVVLASVVAVAGLQLRLTPYPLVNLVLTLVFLVGITNAFNLLDNMDGLAAGIAAIAAAFRLAFFVMDGNAEGALVAAVFLGAVLGFLVRNAPPASIFLGDAGALFIGFFVAGLSLTGGYPYSRNMVSVLVMPVLILLVPIFDTSFVTINRTLERRSVSVGGRDHLSHRLVALGLSERRTLLLLYGLAVASGLVASISYRLGLSYGVVLIAFMVVAAVVLGVRLSADRTAPRTLRARASALFSRGRQALAVFLDAFLVSLAFLTAVLLRFEGVPAPVEPLIPLTMPLVIACQMVALGLGGLYRGIGAEADRPGMGRLAAAGSLGTAAATTADLWLGGLASRSLSVFAIDWLLLIVFLSAGRLAFGWIDRRLQGETAGGTGRIPEPSAREASHD